ncbi:MAG TPA: urate hydroxylase PuuD [Terriglobales bacterium]|nr:urate hydroxylase PuuD [Terriglobales bacterium]
MLNLMAFSMPTHTNTENLQIILRWAHFLAGITWIGLLYFFNLINVPFMKSVTEAPMRQHIFKNLTLPALFWFRWGAVVTVFAGFWYWAQTIVAVDAHNGGGNAGAAIGLFLLLWTVTFAIEYAIVLKAPDIAAINKGPVFAVIAAILLGAAAYLFVNMNMHGWESSRMISIGIGGGFGWVMMFNVWGIIWRNNKKIINGALAGTPAPDAAKLARQAFLASRTNAWLSIPMLFFMAAASHYVIFG